MADYEVIRSYLVEIGFEAKQPEIRKMEMVVGEALHRIEEMTSGLAKVFVGLGVTVVGAFTAIAAGTVGVMQHVAEADQQFRLLGMRMGMSTMDARKMQQALDALGASLEDVYWDPELNERFNKLMEVQDKLYGSMGEHFEDNMRKVRDLNALFQEFKLDLTVLKDFVVMDLVDKLKLTPVYDKFRTFIDALENDVPGVAKMVSDTLWPILVDVGNAIKTITEETMKFIGFLAGDKEQTGEITVENIRRATTDLVTIFKNLVHYVEVFFGYLKKIKEEIQPILDWIEDHPKIAAAISSVGLLGAMAAPAIGGGSLLGGLLGGEAGVGLLGLGGEGILAALGVAVGTALVAGITNYIQDKLSPEELEAQDKRGEQTQAETSYLGGTLASVLGLAPYVPISEDKKPKIDWFPSLSDRVEEAKKQIHGAWASAKEDKTFGPPGSVLWRFLGNMFRDPQENIEAGVSAEIKNLGSAVKETHDWTRENVMKAVAAAAVEKGIPPEIALAMARTESNFRQIAGPMTRHGQAFGVMQLMPGTAEATGVDRNDVLGNISGGLDYLKSMYERFHDWDKAIAAYNMGPYNLNKVLAGRMTMPAETAEYVKNIESRAIDIGGITINAAPGQDPKAIAQAVWEKVEEKLNQRAARDVARHDGPYG